MREKHAHKLRRHAYKTGNAVFFCALPDCSFKIATALALGKKCLCWRCGDTFILNEYSIRLAKPHCDKCHRPKTSTLNMEQIEAEIAEIIPSEQPAQPTINSIEELRSRLAELTASTDDEGDI